MFKNCYEHLLLRPLRHMMSTKMLQLFPLFLIFSTAHGYLQFTYLSEDVYRTMKGNYEKAAFATVQLGANVDANCVQVTGTNHLSWVVEIVVGNTKEQLLLHRYDVDDCSTKLKMHETFQLIEPKSEDSTEEFPTSIKLLVRRLEGKNGVDGPAKPKREIMEYFFSEGKYWYRPPRK